MREIKFRAWDGEKMEHDIAVGMHHKDTCDYPSCVQLEDGDCVWIFHEPPVAIMQYSGLKDTKGVEIYEGDVVRVKGEIYCLVDWDDNNAQIYLKTPGKGDDFNISTVLNPSERAEVVGNIYQDPDLREAS